MTEAIPSRSSIHIALEPVFNALNSFRLLNEVPRLPGLNTWVIRTAETLDPEFLHINRLVFEGLRDALILDAHMDDFPAYIHTVALQKPEQVRDRVLEGLQARLIRHGFSQEGGHAVPSCQRLLDDRAAYLHCMAQVQGAHLFDSALHTEAHTLLHDSYLLHTTLMSHLEALWKLFTTEWRRVRSSLSWQVDMFSRALKQEEPLADLYRRFTGRDLPASVQTADSTAVALVPSGHCGQQVMVWESAASTYVFFSTPPNYDVAQLQETRMGSAELQARLGALTDETRLRIIALLMEQDEREAQDIIAALELSQSSVSRHLKQLVAAKYVYERRGEGANKTYRLSPFYFAYTARAIEKLVAGEGTQPQVPDEREAQPEELRRFLNRSGKLATWPLALQRDKRIILAHLASFFELDRVYSEKEVNEELLLHLAVQDSATLRRALCEFGFMNRTRDGSRYWLMASPHIEHIASDEWLYRPTSEPSAYDPLANLSAEELRQLLRSKRISQK